MIPQAYILPSSHIDTVKWNLSISHHANGLIYSGTDYLNAMCTNWHGIVIDDYRAVMAVPWRIKWGFRYSYMPAFTQQLGLIGDYTVHDVEAIFRTLPDFVSFADIHFNYANRDIQSVKKLPARTNLVIDLSKGYDAITSRYKKNLTDVLRKNNSLSYEAYDVESCIQLYADQYREKVPDITDSDYEHFSSLCQSFDDKSQCIVRCMRDSQQQLLSAALLLRDDHRIYNMINATTAEGRKQEANDYLLDNIIREFAGQNVDFDFEGSEMPGVKAFYKKFGAEDQPYFYYRFNGLPWPFRLFKR